MRGPSDKKLTEMTPYFRFKALKKYISEYLDWLMITSAYRAEHEAPFDDEYDHVADDLRDLVETLRDYADAIERNRTARLRRTAEERRIEALRAVTVESGYSAGEVANAQNSLRRIEAKS